MDSTETEKQVFLFVSDFCGVPIKRLTADTELLEDLGVDGDDAFELVMRFAKQFNVDLSRFDIARHFGPEAPAGILQIMTALVCRLMGDKKKSAKTPLRMSDLVKAAWKHELLS